MKKSVDGDRFAISASIHLEPRNIGLAKFFRADNMNISVRIAENLIEEGKNK